MTIQLIKETGLAELTFNRPKSLNAFNADMAEDLLSAIRDISEDDAVRVVVLKGAGPAFMAGGDIRFFQEKLGSIGEIGSQIIDQLNKVIEQFYSIKVPVVAVVHGSCAGVGMSLMLAADLVIAREDTVFTTAYTKLGISPDGGLSFALPRVVGSKKALQLALLAERFTAQEAKEWGLINWVFSEDVMEREVQGVVDNLVSGPKEALAATKRLVRGSWGCKLEGQLEAEKACFIETAASRNFQEGVNAFLEKRKAEFV